MEIGIWYRLVMTTLHGIQASYLSHSRQICRVRSHLQIYVFPNKQSLHFPYKSKVIKCLTPCTMHMLSVNSLTRLTLTLAFKVYIRDEILNEGFAKFL